MGVAPQGLCRAQADLLHRILDQAATFRFALGQPKALDRHLQHMIDPVKRVVGGIRVLIDRLDFPDQRPLFLCAHAGQVFAPIHHLSHVGRKLPHHQERQRAFAAAALAGNGGDRRAVIGQREGHLIDGNGDIFFAKPFAAKNFRNVLNSKQLCHDGSLRET